MKRSNYAQLQFPLKKIVKGESSIPAKRINIVSLKLVKESTLKIKKETDSSCSDYKCERIHK